MLKSYPPSELDHSGYIGALANCLAQYPKCLAVRCADPVNGVVATTRFKPTIADLTVWCERELQGMRGIVDRDDQEQRWATERTQAADRERELIAKFKSPEEIERVKAKLAETLESLSVVMKKKTAAAFRAEAEETLVRCAFEASLPSNLSVSDELRKILVQR